MRRPHRGSFASTPSEVTKVELVLSIQRKCTQATILNHNHLKRAQSTYTQSAETDAAYLVAREGRNSELAKR